MSDELFNTNDFLSTTFEEVPPDKSTPIPAGEYNVQIGNDDKALAIAQGTKDGRPWKRLDVMFTIADPTGALKETHGETPKVRYGVMLDLTDDDPPRLDMGVNRSVKLGKLLEVTGVRKPGWKFTDLYLKNLKIKVINKPDKDDPTQMRHDIIGVAVAG